MKTTITMELSKKSLDEVKSLIREYKNNYERAVCDSVKLATEALYNKVLQNCYENGISNHVDAIHWEYNENTRTGRVWVNGSDERGQVIIFNEMGTGVVGLYHPHPMLGDWQYDKGEHGDNGWWYPTTENDPNPTKRICKDGILRAWTKGLPSRRMFYDAYCYIADELAQYVEIEMKKNIGNLYQKE